MRRKQSRAARAGHTVAYILLISCVLAVFVISAGVAFGITILPPEKMIAMLIFMVYLTARVGGNK